MDSHTAFAERSQGLDAEDDRVHEWRVMQLNRLGLAWPVADAVADRIDWHEVAKLVQRGCPATLAVAIIE